jgi:hypothetical protein
MLTLIDYIALWNHRPNGIDSFATITGIAPPPPYADYVIRENMLEDYLDIFRGINTRHTRPIIPFGDDWYYPHPFFNADGSTKLKEKPCIKYVLIAEAPPQVNGGVINYIYNLHLAGGAYITAPLKAFGINPNGMNKLNRLINLANQGVLIIDIFPFAINYNRFRNDINLAGITLDFFNNFLNLYSIAFRINNIQNLFCYDFKKDNRLNAALIGPPITSLFIADYINTPHLTPGFLNFRIGHNVFLFPNVLPPPIPPISYIYPIIIPNSLMGVLFNYPLVTVAGGNIFRVPYYACCCYNETRGENPRDLFIKSALGL